MMLILKAAGVIEMDPYLPLYENNIVAYIEFLEQAGRMGLIPLYASRLSKERGIQTLSRVLINVTEHDERRELVKLMDKYDIDTARVLQQQAFNIYLDTFEFETRKAESYPRNIVLAPRRGRHMLHDIKLGFIGTEISNKDELLIRSLEWHQCLEGHWEQICTIARDFYERCFGKTPQPHPPHPVHTYPFQSSAALPQPERCASASSSKEYP